MSSLLLLYYSRGRKGTNFPEVLITGRPRSFREEEDPHDVSHTLTPVFWSRKVCRVPADYKDRLGLGQSNPRRLVVLM